MAVALFFLLAVLSLEVQSLVQTIALQDEAITTLKEEIEAIQPLDAWPSKDLAGPGDGLWLRLIGDSATESDLAVHTWSAAVWCWQRGDCTQAQIIAAFDLQGTDQTDGLSFKSSFNTMTENQAARQAMDIHWYLILAEDDMLTRTQFNTLVETSLAAP